MDFSPDLKSKILVRLCWKAKRQEQSTQSKIDRNCFLHVLFYVSIHASLDARPFSLDHPIRSHQYVRRNRHADLLGYFEIDNELEFHRLFYW